MLSLEAGRDTRFDADSRWFAIQARHHHEKIVARILLNKGFNIFLPTYESVRRWADRAKRLSLPLFPGYVFLSNDVDRRYQIVSTPGVQDIVRTANIPAVIPHEEILRIRQMVESMLPVEPHPFLNEGDRVRIKYGPLVGLEGILSQKRDGLRLVLSVHLLGRSAAVLVDASMVEPVSLARAVPGGLSSSARDPKFPATGARDSGLRRMGKCASI